MSCIEAPRTDHMVVSDPLAFFEKEGMLRVIAPAKTNLVLAVGPLHSDGYHEVMTIMHALSLHDILHVDYFSEGTKGLEVTTTCLFRKGFTPINIPPEDNLVTRAILLLGEKLSRTQNERFVIRIEKHIPVQAGLGGGSSDAAAALVAAANLWDIDLFDEAVLSAAAELGSDVSFFLYGGCAYLSGRGETFERSLVPMEKALVIVKPEGGVSTRDAYRLFDKSPVSVPEDILTRAESVKSARELVPFNNLTAAAEQLLPELAQIRFWAEEQAGVEAAFLSGSGSATIIHCETFSLAHALVVAAKKQGWWARATSYSPMRACIVPKNNGS